MFNDLRDAMIREREEAKMEQMEALKLENARLRADLEEKCCRVRDQFEEMESMEEKMRDMNALIGNLQAENTALKRKIVGVSEVIDDLIESEIKNRELVEDCRMVLIKMQNELDRK